MRFADKIEYADGGVVSKQVLKNDAGNITLFAFDEEQGLAEPAHRSTPWCRCWTVRPKSGSAANRSGLKPATPSSCPPGSLTPCKPPDGSRCC